MSENKSGRKRGFNAEQNILAWITDANAKGLWVRQEPEFDGDEPYEMAYIGRAQRYMPSAKLRGTPDEQAHWDEHFEEALQHAAKRHGCWIQNSDTDGGEMHLCRSILAETVAIDTAALTAAERSAPMFDIRCDLRDRLFTLVPELPGILIALRDAGATRTLIVGGAARDLVRGADPDDVDVEVYGLNLDRLAAVLDTFGNLHANVGESFGTTKLYTPRGQDLDFTLPRRESKTGPGHRDFSTEFDPTMTLEEAAERRDFAWNAIALDPDTCQLYDLYGGQYDLDRAWIRVTSDKFSEDPLRPLRGLALAGKLDLKLPDGPAGDQTRVQCQAAKAGYRHLTKDRIWKEWLKWANKSVRPSAGLNWLKDIDWLDIYPALANLFSYSTPQDPEWHPEGDAGTHTLIAVDVATQIANREGLSRDTKGTDGYERAAFMFATLLHDADKPHSTVLNDKGRWVSPGHAEGSVPIAEDFLRSIGAPQIVIDLTLPLIREHMIHVNPVSAASVRRLAGRLQPANIRQLLRIIEADHSARPPLPGGLPASAARLGGLASEQQITEKPVEPILLGRHLIERGMTPGPAFKPILNAAFEAQLAGEFADLAGALDWLTKYLPAQDRLAGA